MSQPLTDAGVGRALFTTRFMLSWQAFQMCLFFGALPAFIAPYLLWCALASPTSVDLVRLDALSHVYSESTATRWRLRDEQGELRAVEAVLPGSRFVQWMTPPQVREVLHEPLGRAVDGFGWVFRLSLLSTVVGFLTMNWWLRRLGGISQRDERIRGALDLVPGRSLSRSVRRAGGGRYALVDVALPLDAPQRGILVMGSQGSGKSIAIHDLMRQVFARKCKTVIYDESGEYFEAYFRPGVDVFFNPALEGSVPWSIFEELENNYDADTLARAFLPPKSGVVHGGSAFFEDAARALFAAILGRLKARGSTATADIARALLEMPAEEMEHLIAKSVASSAVGGDAKGQRQGVISSIAIYLNGIASVKPGRWSVREFLKRPNDARLFLLATEDTKAMFTPLYRLLLSVMMSQIGSLGEKGRDDRYWFFLDEVHTLGDIRLDEVLATKRKYGVCVVSGIQSDKQLVASMGTDRADTIVQCFNTALVLATNDPALQERCAKRLGRQELDQVSRNQALAVNEMRDGAALTRNDSEKWLIMPSEIGQLEPCTGWLKLPGQQPVCTVDYRSWLRPAWRKPPRVSLGNPLVDLPPRDPCFRIQVIDQGDPFERVREEVQALQEARQAEEAQAEAERLASKGQPARRSTPPQRERPQSLRALVAAGESGAPAQALLPAVGASAATQETGSLGAPRAGTESNGTMNSEGSGQRTQAVAMPDGSFVDPETGEILEVDERAQGLGRAIAQQMDTNIPGHTLGLEMGGNEP